MALSRAQWLSIPADTVKTAVRPFRITALQHALVSFPTVGDAFSYVNILMCSNVLKMSCGPSYDIRAAWVQLCFVCACTLEDLQTPNHYHG